MAAIDDLDLVTVVQNRTNKISLRRRLRKSAKGIERRKSTGGRLKFPRFSANAVANLLKQFGLKLPDPLFRTEHFLLPFFELRRRVSLSICKSLTAFVIIGNTTYIALRNLDVVSEDVVESDLEVRNACSRPLIFFKARDGLLG